mgnify:CR=1 FL=1
MKKKISIIYNEGSVSKTNYQQKIADLDTYKTAVMVRRAVINNGYKVEVIKYTPKTVKNINKLNSTDVIFNLCEWTGVDWPLSVYVIKELEKKNIPFTGTDLKGMKISCDKLQMKKLMIQNGIRTPDYLVYRGKWTKELQKNIEGINLPVIIKPAWEHCGIGIHQSSVVKNWTNIKITAKIVYEKYHQPILIEEFIAGKEIHVTVIQNSKLIVLPPVEIKYLTNDLLKPILSFEAKWDMKSKEYNNCDSELAKLSKDVMEDVNNQAKRSFQKLVRRGYARIDMRVHAGKAYVLEANANPGLDADPYYQMNISSRSLGWNFENLIGKILACADYR